MVYDLLGLSSGSGVLRGVWPALSVFHDGSECVVEVAAMVVERGSGCVGDAAV